jgi:hypothetical protein
MWIGVNYRRRISFSSALPAGAGFLMWEYMSVTADLYMRPEGAKKFASPHFQTYISETVFWALEPTYNTTSSLVLNARNIR